MFGDGAADSIDRGSCRRLGSLSTVVKGKPSRFTVYQALGIVRLLRWVAGRYDELPGFAPADPHQRSA
jgi:hypothetical protein